MFQQSNSETVKGILVKSGFVLAFVGLITFVVLYYAVSNQISIKQNEDVLKVTELVTHAIESSNEFAQTLEKSMEHQLFLISKAIGEELSGRKAETITVAELERLRDQWDLYDISLFVKKDEDIVVSHSSDPNEIGISSKDWGYWHDAFKQLFEYQQVDLEQGFSDNHYWVGPVSTSSFYGTHFKYAYYHDGSTDFIINPYIEVNELLELVDSSGPSRLIDNMISSSNNIAEIAVINLKPFLSEEEERIVEPDKDLPVLYGKHSFTLDEDIPIMTKALDEKIDTSVSYQTNDAEYNKMYISLPNERLLTIVMDISEMNSITNRVLVIMTTIFILAFVTMLLFAKKINRRALWMLNKIHHHAYYDSLTNLPNRHFFMEKLQKSIEQGREHTNFAVFMIDLDHFKNVNDTLGHAAGDQFLQHVAERIKLGIQDKGFISRMGGDEFTVILPISDRQDAEDVAVELLNGSKQTISIENHQFVVSMCIGISLFPEDGSDATTLLKHADMALYQRKNSEKNNYSFFSIEMRTEALQKSHLQEEMRKSLEHEHFMLYYQPQLDLKTNQVIGMEALVRWKHPTMGLVMPNDFIPHAEECGLIIPLGEWIIQEAFRQYKQFDFQGTPPIRMSVNLSVKQFNHKYLFEHIEAILQNTGMDPESLTLEITESTSMIDVDYTIDVITRLRSLGVKIAIDDFGMAYSSLSYLNRFDIDILKIDRSFVNKIFVDQYCEVVIKTILDLANSLGIKVVAEGVETVEQIQFLTEHGCHEVQGYYISRPISFEDVQQFIQQNNSNSSQ